jgi:hypothetical protein
MRARAERRNILTDRLRLPLPAPAFANERRDNRHRPCRLGHDCRAGTVYRLVRWPTRLLESWHDRSCGRLACQAANKDSAYRL